MQEDEAIKDILTALDEFEDSHLNPVLIECDVSIEINDSDDESESSSTSAEKGRLSAPSTVASSSSSSIGILKTMGEKIRLLPSSQEKAQLKQLHDAFLETYREKSSSSQEEVDRATKAFVSQCRGIMNRRLSPTMLKI